MKLLNLGCGNHYHTDWINIDFISTGENIIAHDLRKGIPFENNCFDVVYHSHILEHFNKTDGQNFIKECCRVLKPNGIIRIAVPDLEEIAKHYIDSLEKALNGEFIAKYNYEWILLEMYDQVVRNYSGGEMAKYLYQEKIHNEEFVYNRLGFEAKNTRQKFLESKKKGTTENMKNKGVSIKKYFQVSAYKNYLKRKLFADELKYIEIGKFRLGGEIHQWMYDRYSLFLLLEQTGFKNIKQKTFKNSQIPNWSKYKLEETNEEERKPDSLYMEAVK